MIEIYYVLTITLLSYTTKLFVYYRYILIYKITSSYLYLADSGSNSALNNPYDNFLYL